MYIVHESNILIKRLYIQILKCTCVQAKTLAQILTVLSCVFWGFAGYFIRELSDLGLDSMQIMQLRCAFTAAMIFIACALYDIRILKLSKRDLSTLVIFAAVALFYGYAYNEAMERLPLSVASILEMTSPYFVLFLSLLIFREKITGVNLVSAIMAFAGALMITGFAGDGDFARMGILFGILSGFALAVCSIGVKLATDRNGNIVGMFFWVVVIAGLGTMLFANPVDSFRVVAESPRGLWLAIGNALLITVIPYAFQGFAFMHLSASTISILSISQCAFCGIVGFYLFDEVLKIGDIVGILIMTLSLVLICIGEEGLKSLRS